MHDETDRGRRHADSPWADEQTRQHLQVLVEGVATLAGFAQSSLTLRRDGHFEVVAAAGVEDGFVGTQVPAQSIRVPSRLSPRTSPPASSPSPARFHAVPPPAWTTASRLIKRSTPLASVGPVEGISAPQDR